MVTVKCSKHGQHVMKPLDASVLLEWAVVSLAEVAFHDPLPVVEGVSEPHLLRQALCPQEELERIKSGEISIQTL